ncbi:hypothetical protein UFOVP399_61 [uncultured Caudovirales phage]|uniref:Uncharacterized protein n=1 Tax=uncultured Caudovirales phage TaxID=2100421 RepID=A0A6J5M435_9CAUD|nr:hypothetical protein UFOVP399_61 [uncultured Caudovirales phage]
MSRHILTAIALASVLGLGMLIASGPDHRWLAVGFGVLSTLPATMAALLAQRNEWLESQYEGRAE